MTYSGHQSVAFGYARHEGADTEIAHVPPAYVHSRFVKTLAGQAYIGDVPPPLSSGLGACKLRHDHLNDLFYLQTLMHDRDTIDLGGLW